MMELGHIIGWVGVAFGLLVPLPQLYKIYKTKRTTDISLLTYSFLCICLVCYMVHAIYIQSAVFTAAQSINLTTNTAVLALLIRGRNHEPQ
jgi:MtN3 and saliva related transmembrane protein